MAGVAFAAEGDGVGFATESYAASALYTTLASLSGALWRIRRARSGLVNKEADHDRNLLFTHPAQPSRWVSRNWCRQLASNAFRRRTRAIEARRVSAWYDQSRRNSSLPRQCPGRRPR